MFFLGMLYGFCFLFSFKQIRKSILSGSYRVSGDDIFLSIAFGFLGSILLIGCFIPLVGSIWNSRLLKEWLEKEKKKYSENIS